MSKTDWQQKNLKWAIKEGFVNKTTLRMERKGDKLISSAVPTKMVAEYFGVPASRMKLVTGQGDKITKLSYQCGVAWWGGVQNVADMFTYFLNIANNWDTLPDWSKYDYATRPELPEALKGLDHAGPKHKKLAMDTACKLLQLYFNPKVIGVGRAAWLFTSVNSGVDTITLQALKRWSFNPITDWQFNENSGMMIRIYGLCCTKQEHFPKENARRYANGAPRLD